MKNKMNIVFLGAPGSGKGTQSSMITEQYNLIPVVAGDILRDEKKSGSSLGKEISEIIDSGDLVPDSMIDDIIKNYLFRCAIDYIPTGYVFDGYPRTLGQGENLDNLMLQYSTQIDVVFFLDVDKGELVKRILERGKTSGRDDDQSEDIINKRMENYFESTEPLINFYEDRLVRIDGSKSIEDISYEIRDVLVKMMGDKMKNL